MEVAHLDKELETATVGKLQNGTWLENPRVGKVTGMGEHRQENMYRNRLKEWSLGCVIPAS